MYSKGPSKRHLTGFVQTWKTEYLLQLLDSSICSKTKIHILQTISKLKASYTNNGIAISNNIAQLIMKGLETMITSKIE